MHLDMPSKKLFFYFVPIIIGLVIFVTFREKINQRVMSNSQSSAISVVNSNNTNTDSPWNPSKEDLAIIKKLKDGTPLQNNTTSDGKNVSVTGQVAMKLFADNVSLQQNGLNSVSNLKDLALNTANNVLSSNAKDIYTEKDLKIIPINSGTASLLSFVNAFILESNKANNQIYAMDTENKLADPSSPDFSPTMKSVSKLYDVFAKNLVSIPVPQEIKNSYLLLVNSYARSSQEYATASVGKDDPLLTVATIVNIKNNQAEQQTIVSSLGNYIQSRGLVYSESLGLYVVKSK
jgi:hypothetical protein